MGMYTEYTLKFSISKDNQDVLRIINYMIDGESPPLIESPNHPLFSTARWDLMARSGRSFIDERDYLETVDVVLMGEFKNYHDEINLFIDWITPHLDNYLIGHSWYEGDVETTPYFIEAE